MFRLLVFIGLLNRGGKFMAAEEKDAVTFGETVTASEFDLATDHDKPLPATKSS